MKKILMSVVGLVMCITTMYAQNTPDERMERDIQVAENVLGTLVKQQFEKNMIIPVDVQGSYRSGFGVTFSLPNFSFFPMNYLMAPRAPRAPGVQVYSGQGGGYTYSIQTDEEGDVVSEEFSGDLEEAEEIANKAKRDAEVESHRKLSGRGSVSTTEPTKTDKDLKEQNKLLIEAAKTFLADYSTIISQLKPEERIVITNRGTESGNRYWRFMGDEKRFFLSVEANGADIKQYQTGKLSREQFLGKINVVESEVEAERIQDLELLSTIFDRLYQSDLSATFFTDGSTYYERLKDYGAIFYMQVFSSNQMDRGYFSMPTQRVDRISEEERNKKVTELYPTFEKELKENILEYGRTIKSLKPTEVLVFNVRLTKCKECGIPSSVEITTKASVLSDYLLGKLDKNAALSKIEVKQGAKQ